MPRGTPCTVEGLLAVGRAGLLALRTDHGGTWEIDGPSRLRRLVGRRVQVNGFRSGFDMLDVERFAPV